MSRSMLELRSPALDLVVGLVPWDSEFFGVPVAQIESIRVHEPVEATSQAQAMLDWLEVNHIRLASCRLLHDSLAESFLIESLGFRFVEMVYAMKHDLQSLDAEEVGGLVWTRASSDDLPALRKVASEAFTTGRWNVDSRVGSEAAGRRYADWVSRSLSNDRHQVMTASVDGALVAFFIVENLSADSSYWHLTAVANEFQGRGWGRRVWRSMLQQQRMHGMRAVATTISARNLPVVNLYAQLGWRFAQNHMTFHWVSPEWRGAQASSGAT